MFSKWVMLVSVGSFHLPGSRTGCVTRANPFSLQGPQLPPEDEGVEGEVSCILSSSVPVWLSDVWRKGNNDKGSGTQNLKAPTPAITYQRLQSHSAQLPPSGCVGANRGGEGRRCPEEGPGGGLGWL